MHTLADAIVITMHEANLNQHFLDLTDLMKRIFEIL